MMKQKTKEQLQNIDFPKYCKQMGILESDGLRFITNRKEFEQLAAKHDDAGAHRAIDRRCLGKCHCDIRAIFVNENPCVKHGIIHRTVHGKGRMKQYYKIVPKKWNYYEQRHTLIHELIHFRFPHMKHGRAFDDRIEEILKGRTFEPKHIHFFASFDKQWTYLIDGSTNEEIEAYHKKAATLKATRDAYNEKLIKYWEARRALEDLINEPYPGLDWATICEIRDLMRRVHNKRLPIEQSTEQLRKKKEEVIYGSKSASHV